jgi:hypothetical protein
MDYFFLPPVRFDQLTPLSLQNINKPAPVPYKPGSNCLLNNDDGDDFLRCVQRENARDFASIAKVALTPFELSQFGVTNPVKEPSLMGEVKNQLDSTGGLIEKYGADLFSVIMGITILGGAIFLIGIGRD